MVRYVIYSVLFASFAASALTLDDFSPVHKARVERKGANDVVLVMNSGEFHFGCYDRGMFKPGLAPVWNQAERARSYTRFVDVCDRPYPELTRAARKLGAELYEKRVKGVW